MEKNVSGDNWGGGKPNGRKKKVCILPPPKSMYTVALLLFRKTPGREGREEGRRGERRGDQKQIPSFVWSCSQPAERAYTLGKIRRIFLQPFRLS